MKFLIVALTLLIGSHALSSDSNEKGAVFLKKFFSKTREFIDATLPDVGGQIHDEIEKYVNHFYNKIGINYTEFENALRREECLKKYNGLALCDIMTQKLIDCSKKPVAVLESSVSDLLKGTPTLIMMTTHSLAEFACNAKGKQLMELLNPCVVNNGEEIASCFKSTASKTEDKPVNIKDLICKVAKKYKICLGKIVNEECSHELTKKSVTSFLDALTTPCFT